MRLIDGDKLIDIITYSSDLGGVWGQVLRAVKDAFIRLIRTMPTVNSEPHWIPVSEQLPEMDARVLVTRGGYDYYVWDCMSNRGDDYFWEDEEGFYHNKYEVMAWMPLPEPWGGDAE